jgi:cation diffusion facilitator CzcD-associated flavoprotein CzcO
MTCEVAIVGAGPYGLSIAAHLGLHGIPYRIFGPPMATWREAMPAGMFLKSEGFASSLSHPRDTFTLAHFCTAHGIPYADIGLPVPRSAFADYGIEFQRRFASHLDSRLVAKIEREPSGFLLTLEDGELVRAARVILAIGITHYAHIPDTIAELPDTRLSHSSTWPDLSRFAGQKVVVVGAGASALDCAALLAKAGARVDLVARQKRIHFHEPPAGRPRTLWETLRAPMSGLGPGWRSRLCTDAPQVFRLLPEFARLEIVRRHLGPAPGWWTRAGVEGQVKFNLGKRLRSAHERDGRVVLDVEGTDGGRQIVEADHVIAATGYKVDIHRLPFMTPSLISGLRLAGQSPVLSRNFESSVPGLYFVGISAASSFGPMMRFAFGAAYTAKRLTRHLSARTRRAGLSVAEPVPSRA